MSRNRVGRWAVWAAGFLAALAWPVQAGPVGGGAQGGPAKLTAPPGQPPVASVPGVLEVKFREGREIRLRGGVPVDVAAGRAVALPRRLADAGAQWARSFPDVGERTLEKMQRRAGPARAARGRAGADLNLYFRVRFSAGADLAALENALRGLPEVAAVHRVPMLHLPAAPDYLSPANGSGSWQRYVDAAPHGVDARFAWANGFTGAGVKVCDVEYLWNAAHTDLPAVSNLLANPGDAGYGDDHGTAVLGMLAGKNNGQGVKGIAYGAGFYFAGVYINDDFNVGNAVLAAANVFGTGDVILVEAQILGPTGQYAPVEWYKPYYDAITLAVDMGVVIVAAAGNGSQNLDDPVYSTGNDGHWPFRPENDSGAILVGAGAPPDYPNPRSRLDFSNYGSTVDLQGWGYSVVTTGYGDLYSAEGRNSWFTGTFSGTSSASPMVAGAAAVLQQAYREEFGQPAPPAQIRQMLRATGTPQAGADIIGPLPNLQAALAAVLPVLSITPAAHSRNYPAGTTSFQVAISQPEPLTYTATSTRSWLQVVSGAAGGFPGTVGLAFSANPGAAARTGTVTVAAAGAAGSPRTYRLVQRGDPRVDLAVRNVRVTRPANPAARTFRACRFEVRNRGPASWVGTLKVEFFLSRDARFGNSDDRKIGETTYRNVSIRSGTTRTVVLDSTRRAQAVSRWTARRVPAGNYHLYVRVRSTAAERRPADNANRTSARLGYR